MEIEKKVREMIEDKVVELGFVLDSVEYLKEDGLNILRVTIDKSGYVNIEDCEIVSKAIDPMFDDVEFIEDSYILEVSSKEKGEIEDGQ